MADKKTDKSKKEENSKAASKKTVASKKNATTKKTAKPAKAAKTSKQAVLSATNTVIQAPLARPDAQAALTLVVQVMNDFITAKQEKSMEHFFHTIAKKWQDMTTVEKLNNAFKTIIADPTNWDFLKTVKPTLIKEGLSERGDWVAVGVYPTKPKKLIFDQIFINEDNQWKIAELKLFISD